MEANINNDVNQENEIYEDAELLQEELEEHNKKKPKMSKMTIFFILLLIAILVITGMRVMDYINKDEPVEEEILTNVEVMQAEVGSISVTAPVSGKIAANAEENVAVTMAGKVTSLNVKVGDYINSGDVIYTVEAIQAQETYNQAKIACDSAQENLKLLKTNLDRMRSLYSEGAVALSEVESLESQYATAELSAQRADSALAQASESLDMTSVTAPISGYVSAVNLSKGVYAMAGSVAVVITDVSTLKVTSSISEYMISSVNKGDKVDITVKSAKDASFTGTITNVAKSPSAGTLTYPIEISFSNPNGVIKAGMFAEIRFTSSMKNNVVQVPSQSVTIKSGKSIVAVVNNGVVEIREVQTGIDNGDKVEITSGLSSGESVVVKGQTYVNDGETVNVVE